MKVLEQVSFDKHLDNLRGNLSVEATSLKEVIKVLKTPNVVTNISAVSKMEF